MLSHKTSFTGHDRKSSRQLWQRLHVVQRVISRVSNAAVISYKKKFWSSYKFHCFEYIFLLPTHLICSSISDKVSPSLRWQSKVSVKIFFSCILPFVCFTNLLDPFQDHEVAGAFEGWPPVGFPETLQVCLRKVKENVLDTRHRGPELDIPLCYIWIYYGVISLLQTAQAEMSIQLSLLCIFCDLQRWMSDCWKPASQSICPERGQNALSSVWSSIPRYELMQLLPPSNNREKQTVEWP